ncbi:MAG: hypothetical protein AABX88_03270, partial [Nanoarchaeota archaeon]
KNRELEKILSETYIERRINDTLWGFKYSYEAEKDSVQYEVIEKDMIKMIEVAQLKEYVQKTSGVSVLKPVKIKDNFNEAEVYFAMMFDKPRENEKINEIIMGIGLDYSNSGINKVVKDVIASTNLWPWADGQIIMRKKDNKFNAKLWFNGVECNTIKYCSRGIAQRLYRRILGAIKQEEGRIHHRYEECDAPRIIDTGGIRYNLKGL